jgi:methyl-accepting chemotaxis protein
MAERLGVMEMVGGMRRLADLRGQVMAINNVLAVIEFSLDGTIITANENFLKTVGYSLAEIKGRHHRIFVTPAEAQTAAYQAFWVKLGRGEFDEGQYQQLAKDGRSIWLQASYNPIFGWNGKPFKVVEYATDITQQKMLVAQNEGMLAAIGKAQGMIEFDLNGNVLTANDNMLSLMGYSLAEIKGRHHSLFVAPSYAQSAEYRAFWERLRAGHHDAGQYRRVGKAGREIWLQASYNPILEASGRPFKVVKLATDVTDQVRTVEEVRALVQAAVEGDLTQQIATQGRSGNLLALSQAVNSVVDTMKSMVAQIRAAVSTVRTGADEIAKCNIDLSQRTEQQAAGLEETASSMEEMTSSVKQSADNAAQASELASAAWRKAESGASVVSEAVSAMQGINSASSKIADIIGVIDEIAFQTNLLALNAAVEAARAGEQGRGFAVVAAEVRGLASRSAAAAKQIKALIQDSVARVAEGSRLVGQSGKTLSEIVTAVNKATGVVAEIAAATQEQAAGIEQVNTALMSMDEVTQRNAAMVEEGTVAAQSLLEEARNLDGMMAKYKIGENSVVAQRATEPRRERAARVVATSAHRGVTGSLPKGSAAASARKNAPAVRPARTGTNGSETEWKDF